VLETVQPAGQGKGLLPPTQCLWDSTWSSMSSFGIPRAKQTLKYWSKPNRQSPRWVGRWSTGHPRTAWDNWSGIVLHHEVSHRPAQSPREAMESLSLEIIKPWLAKQPHL